MGSKYLSNKNTIVWVPAPQKNGSPYKKDLADLAVETACYILFEAEKGWRPSQQVKNGVP
ncbi:hypothetical protein GGTG_13744 [Gaeumannomyces tritici R3-111a-1]|uniref:Uncharacterized protein n=1 Tax=Gaeumannomyces tritici (strain R3-111a-1) TaxID=644352 RepID=J3PJQ6_GAET3|nr:hypothetical protein GGTG_13744 [Gaeumannomyces tritici R3-111a-1]EJT68681.1 hypothetical protein GGTG_13744 [Gaeumannomyces tritici R3-111a-1]